MRPLGALRDPEELRRGEPLHRLVAAARTTLAEAVDLRPHAKRIVDQRGNSCVGHALAQCLRVRADIDGVELDPSAIATYTLARELDDPIGALRDEGSYPNRAIEGLSDWGAVARSRWPDDADLGSKLPVDVLEAGAVAHVTGEYHVGVDRKLEIMQALSAGHPVFFSMLVDASYMAYAGGLWTGPSGEIRGGHAQAIVGYDCLGVIAANSWGAAWGARGFSHIAWGWIEGESVHDLYVITAAPLEVA